MGGGLEELQCMHATFYTLLLLVWKILVVVVVILNARDEVGTEGKCNSVYMH